MQLRYSIFPLVLASQMCALHAQTPRSQATPMAASAPTAIPALVPYAGVALSSEGKPITHETAITFFIYKEERGGQPMWMESQTALVDSTGHFKVQLGAANPNGLPSDLFSTGEARWLEVQIAGQSEQPRVLLASVPYALKAADAATLGGLPASAFALAGANRAVNDLAASRTLAQAVTPEATLTVTTTGGTTNSLTKFSSNDSIVNSILYDNGTAVGIGTTSPSSTLTVSGTMTVTGQSIYRGPLLLASSGTATTATGYNSQALEFNTSGYNSSSKTVVNPRFQLQAEWHSNNTSLPTAAFNLLYSSTVGTATETGLSFNPNGTIHFVPSQTFGSTSAAGIGFNGTSTSGTGVEGTSTSGSGVVGNSAAITGTIAGVTGINDSEGGVGVFGSGTTLSATGQIYRNARNGAGVWGDSAIPETTYLYNFGVMGTADDEYAGVFYNNSPGYEALWGYNTTDSRQVAAALLGGQFGACIVDTSGDLNCSGSKSAVVPVDNNSRKVALYAVESPENWFEDFGSAQLSNGSATVKLEPTFGQTVNLTTDYHVFLTPSGDSKGLYISKKTPTSFEVRESGSGHSSIAFDYRIVARRKGYETIRMADKTKLFDLSRAPLPVRGGKPPVKP